MALQIINAGPAPEDTVAEIHKSIAAAIPDAEIEVQSGGPGHFEIRVRSGVFAGRGRVAQQQLVYKAITHLMSGPNAPVHAVDRLECLLP